MSKPENNGLKRTLDVAKNLITGLVGTPMVIYSTAFLAYIESQRLAYVIGHGAAPDPEAATNWFFLVNDEVLEPIQSPTNYTFDNNIDVLEPGNLATISFLLHALSTNTHLSNDRFNSNAFVAIPGWIEYLQISMKDKSALILPSGVHRALCFFIDSLGYAAPTMHYSLPNLLEITEATANDPYRFIPLLPGVLGALWGLGILTTINDISRVSAAFIRNYQRINTSLGMNVADYVYNLFLEDSERIKFTPSQQERLIKSTLEAAGITSAVASEFPNINLQGTLSVMYGVGQTAIAINAIQCNKDGSPEKIARLKHNLRVAVTPLANVAKAHMRDKYHTI